MQVQLIPLAQVTPAQAEAWRRLADAAVEPNVFLDPRFLLPARALDDETADLRLVVVEEDGEWLAALAVTTKQVAPGVPVRATTTGGTFMTPQAERHHPLVRKDSAAEALAALLRGLTSVGLPGLLQLQHFPDDGVLAETLADVVASTPIRVHERRRDVNAFAYRTCTAPLPALRTSSVDDSALPPRIVRPPLNWDHMRADERRNMRRGARGLERTTGGPLELHDLSQRPEAEDAFLDLQSAGWKGNLGRGGAALRLEPARERWFREVTSAFRRDGDLLALRLAAGGQTLWIGYGLRSAGAYFGFLDAYAEEHARYSPGSIGRIATMTHIFGTTDAPYFDPAFDSRYATVARIFPDKRTHVDLLLSTHGLAAHTVLRAVPMALRLRRSAS